MTFAMALLLTAGLAAHAPQGNNALYGHPTKGGAKSISFPASSIQFWTGTGTNQAIYILAWDDDPSDNNLALAWGVRWNGTATATSLLDTIAAYDSRFNYTLSGSLMASMTYNDGTVNPGSSMNGWCYYHNGDWGQNAWPNEPVANNDVIEMSSSCTFLGTTAMAATDPNPAPSDTSATIAASDITYWVGEGNFEVVFAVNWPDTALAWGYRFSGRSTNVQTVMDAIAAADPRFSYVTGNYGIDDILFIENGDTLHKASGSWWEHTLNGQMSNGVAQQLNDGDFSRWADPTAGVVVDSTYDSTWNYWMYNYAYPQAITPVSAPTIQSATIAAEDITYWVGDGPFKIRFVINWPDTALAWGYRFSARSTNLQQVMNDIAAADNRLSFVSGGYGIDDILFVENGDTLRKAAGSWWEHMLNGNTSTGLSQQLNDGDFSRWADPTAGVVVDSTYDSLYSYWYYNYAYPQTIHPVTAPAPQDATIGFDDIRFWVGEGQNRVIFAVNWVDTALAWGFRFDSSATVLDAMDAIVAADSRFSYDTGSYGIDDILFVENGDTLRKAAGSWWEHTLNGTMSMGMYQPLADGDFSRWYDPTTGVVVDSTYDTAYGGYWTYIYAFPQRIYPAHNPNAPVTGPFCGAVGTEGCTAIAFDDPTIKGWATGCTLVRGSQDLSNPNAPAVTYGTEADAVGPATANTMDVVSLGDGGSATLTFARSIMNGDGYDFAVFENSFNDNFLELAFVEVSTDGETFVRFPATSLTQTDRQIGGTGSVDPTFINNLAGKYRVGYGTPFDLDELRDSTGIDINNINYVRIIDVVGSIDPLLGTRDAFGHMINDPFPTNSYSAGFDLDGVAVLNSANSIAEADAAHMEVYPNPVDSRLQIVLSAPAAHSEAALYDMTGRKVSCQPVEAGTTRLTIATGTLPCGIYMLRLGEQTRKIIIRH